MTNTKDMCITNTNNCPDDEWWVMLLKEASLQKPKIVVVILTKMIITKNSVATYQLTKEKFIDEAMRHLNRSIEKYSKVLYILQIYFKVVLYIILINQYNEYQHLQVAQCF